MAGLWLHFSPSLRRHGPAYSSVESFFTRVAAAAPATGQSAAAVSTASRPRSLLTEPAKRFPDASSIRFSVSCEIFGLAGLPHKRNMSTGTDAVNDDPQCAARNDRLIWVDLEMSGLDPETHHIVEMACLVTDGDLNIVAQSPNLIINHDESVLAGMSDWCKDNFGKSGLLEEIRRSKVSLKEAEDVFVNFVRSHTNYFKSPLAGNSVHVDRQFLRKYMPTFDAHLHYRIVDVSTIKEVARRWYPRVVDHQPRKTNAHRAMADIKESIEELKWYRNNIFRSAL